MSSPEWYSSGLRFTCTQCGNCCTGAPGYVWFTDDEAVTMAASLGVGVAQFLRRYAHVINGRWSLNEVISPYGTGHDCVFLRRDDQGKALCSIYAVRPQQCRTWPFWPEILKSTATWERAAKRCPGVEHGGAGEGKFYPISEIRIIRDSTPEK